jgi:hypothetical protein
MSFVAIQNNAASVVMKAFRLTDTHYFYEDRESKERFEIDAVEVPFEFVTEDPTTGVILSRKERGFLVVGSAVGAIDEWRTGLGRDTTDQPTPYCGDYIVAVKENETEILEKKYKINERDPYSTLGSNNALFQFNTFLAET